VGTRTKATSRGPSSGGGECLGQTSMHPSARKEASADFALTEFSENQYERPLATGPAPHTLPYARIYSRSWMLVLDRCYLQMRHQRSDVVARCTLGCALYGESTGIGVYGRSSRSWRAPLCHVLCECNGSARYGSPPRGAGRRTQNRRERRAGRLVVFVLPSFGGEPLGLPVTPGRPGGPKNARAFFDATNPYSTGARGKPVPRSSYIRRSRK
jgi:hypothetical protein